MMRNVELILSLVVLMTVTCVQAQPDGMKFGEVNWVGHMEIGDNRTFLSIVPPFFGGEDQFLDLNDNSPSVCARGD